MAEVGDMEVVIRTRWDVTDPVAAVVYWLLMVALGSVIGLALGVASQ